MILQLIETNVLIIRSLYINKNSFFIDFLLITFSDFGRLYGVLKILYEIDEQLESKKLKYIGLELKHNKKGFIENFHCILHINQNI